MQEKIQLANDEILALIKLILFTKFESEDSESSLFSGSESINSALQKLLNHHPFYQDKNVDFFGKLPQEYLTVILDKIDNSDPQNMAEDIKQTLIGNWVFPYQV